MRVRLSFPDEQIFKTQISVHISDINYGGHMGNDRFLTMMQEARLQWLHSCDFINEKEIDPPVGLILVDSILQYKAEVFHGEKLNITLAVKDISSKSFDLFYNLEKEDGQVAAIGKTGIVCYDYETKKVVAIPDKLLKNLP